MDHISIREEMKTKLPRRKYKTKWHRYGTTAGVLFVAIGGVIMIFLGIIAFFDQTELEILFLSNFFTIPSEFDFLWSILTLVCGGGILFVTIQQKPHDKETVIWMIVSALLAIIGGTLGGLITFGGVLIYLLLYIL